MTDDFAMGASHHPAREREGDGDTFATVPKVEFEDRLELAWAGAQAALRPGWRLDGLRCASTGSAPELHSELWRAVAVAPSGKEISGEGKIRSKPWPTSSRDSGREASVPPEFKLQERAVDAQPDEPANSPHSSARRLMPPGPLND